MAAEENSRSKLKDGGDEAHKIQLNEDLTSSRAELAFHARQLKRDKHIKDTWTWDFIFIKTSEDKVFVVTHKDQLKEYLG